MTHHRAYKVELKPNASQKQQIERTMGICRYVYNLFISVNSNNYKNQSRKYMNGYEFSKWLNNEFQTKNPDKLWIWEVSSKAVKKAIMNADTAYKDFMKGKSYFPRFKRRNGRPVSMYLPHNNEKDLEVKRHKGKIPTLGWVRFKEYGYVPNNNRAVNVTITKKAGHYYASFVFGVSNKNSVSSVKTEGVGIDLGIKSFAVVSNGKNYLNINKTEKTEKLKRRLKREGRKFSRKLEKLKQRKEETATKKEKRSNLDKQRLKLQKAYKKLADKRRDYINKTVKEIVTASPEYITIEDLNVKGMIKNRHLSKAISECEFGYFRSQLEKKCKIHGIELRIANRFYASSKKCSKCGHQKKDLKLSNRIYECEKCGQVIDRDYNASINLRDCQKYKIV
ncbi:MAG: transposase [Synergistaceae bacterium]|nr:transposase [Synergistaceae bacterium]